METEDKRKLRTAFMNWLFEVTGGSESEGMHAAGFKVPDGWTGAQPNENDVWDALKFLEGERLIRAHWPLGGLPTVMLTHRGIREMEKGDRGAEEENRALRSADQYHARRDDRWLADLARESWGSPVRHVQRQSARERRELRRRRAQDSRRERGRSDGQTPHRAGPDDDER